jgi:hypothetical protein
MENTELSRPAWCTAVAIRQKIQADNAKKAAIIAELEKIVLAQYFGRQPWPADQETLSALNQKLRQMGLWEEDSVEPRTWRITPLAQDLHLDLFQAFMGLWAEYEVPLILVEHGLIDESEFDAVCLGTSEADPDTLLEGYVKRAIRRFFGLPEIWKDKPENDWLATDLKRQLASH